MFKPKMNHYRPFQGSTFCGLIYLCYHIYRSCVLHDCGNLMVIRWLHSLLLLACLVEASTVIILLTNLFPLLSEKKSVFGVCRAYFKYVHFMYR